VQSSVSRKIRSIAVLLALLQGLEAPLWAAADARPSAAPSAPAASYSIPEEFGVSRKPFSAASGDLTIITIQDVHENWSAQLSIAALLEHLAVNYGIRTIGAEGATGQVDLSLFQEYPDAAARRVSAERMVMTGLLSGAELHAATAQGAAVYGVDDEDLFWRNLAAFQDLLAAKPGRLETLDAIAALTDRLEAAALSDKLLELKRSGLLKTRNGANFSQRWMTLKRLAGEAGVDPSEYGSVLALATAVEAGKEVNYEAAGEERGALLDELTKASREKELEELLQHAVHFRMGRISQGAFTSYLLDRARAHGIAAGTYPRLEEAGAYFSAYEKIDFESVRRESKELETKVREALYTNDEERRVHELAETAQLLRDLFEVRLASDGLNVLRSEAGRARAGAFAADLERAAAERGILSGIFAKAAALTAELDEAMTFYRLAEQRNTEMLRRMTARMKRDGVRVGVLVTGGFHARGIAELMKSDDISHVVVLPRFETKADRPYLPLIAGSARSLREHWESAKAADARAEVVAVMLASSLHSEYLKKNLPAPAEITDRARQLLGSFKPADAVSGARIAERVDPKAEPKELRVARAPRNEYLAYPSLDWSAGRTPSLASVAAARDARTGAATYTVRFNPAPGAPKASEVVVDVNADGTVSGIQIRSKAAASIGQNDRADLDLLAAEVARVRESSDRPLTGTEIYRRLSREGREVFRRLHASRHGNKDAWKGIDSKDPHYLQSVLLTAMIDAQAREQSHEAGRLLKARLPQIGAVTQGMAELDQQASETRKKMNELKNSPYVTSRTGLWYVLQHPIETFRHGRDRQIIAESFDKSVETVNGMVALIEASVKEAREAAAEDLESISRQEKADNVHRRLRAELRALENAYQLGWIGRREYHDQWQARVAELEAAEKALGVSAVKERNAQGKLTLYGKFWARLQILQILTGIASDILSPANAQLFNELAERMYRGQNLPGISLETFKENLRKDPAAFMSQAAQYLLSTGSSREAAGFSQITPGMVALRNRFMEVHELIRNLEESKIDQKLPAAKRWAAAGAEVAQAVDKYYQNPNSLFSEAGVAITAAPRADLARLGELKITTIEDAADLFDNLSGVEIEFADARVTLAQMRAPIPGFYSRGTWSERFQRAYLNLFIRISAKLDESSSWNEIDLSVKANELYRVRDEGRGARYTLAAALALSAEQSGPLALTDPAVQEAVRTRSTTPAAEASTATEAKPDKAPSKIRPRAQRTWGQQTIFIGQKAWHVAAAGVLLFLGVTMDLMAGAPFISQKAQQWAVELQEKSREQKYKATDAALAIGGELSNREIKRVNDKIRAQLGGRFSSMSSLMIIAHLVDDGLFDEGSKVTSEVLDGPSTAPGYISNERILLFLLKNNTIQPENKEHQKLINEWLSTPKPMEDAVLLKRVQDELFGDEDTFGESSYKEAVKNYRGFLADQLSKGTVTEGKHKGRKFTDVWNEGIGAEWAAISKHVQKEVASAVSPAESGTKDATKKLKEYFEKSIYNEAEQKLRPLSKAGKGFPKAVSLGVSSEDRELIRLIAFMRESIRWGSGFENLSYAEGSNRSSSLKWGQLSMLGRLFNNESVGMEAGGGKTAIYMMYHVLAGLVAGPDYHGMIVVDNAAGAANFTSPSALKRDTTYGDILDVFGFKMVDGSKLHAGHKSQEIVEALEDPRTLPVFGLAERAHLTNEFMESGDPRQRRALNLNTVTTNDENDRKADKWTAQMSLGSRDYEPDRMNQVADTVSNLYDFSTRKWRSDIEFIPCETEAEFRLQVAMFSGVEETNPAVKKVVIQYGEQVYASKALQDEFFKEHETTGRILSASLRGIAQYSKRGRAGGWNLRPVDNEGGGSSLKIVPVGQDDSPQDASVISDHDYQAALAFMYMNDPSVPDSYGVPAATEGMSGSAREAREDKIKEAAISMVRVSDTGTTVAASDALNNETGNRIIGATGTSQGLEEILKMLEGSGHVNINPSDNILHTFNFVLVKDDLNEIADEIEASITEEAAGVFSDKKIDLKATRALLRSGRPADLLVLSLLGAGRAPGPLTAKEIAAALNEALRSPELTASVRQTVEEALASGKISKDRAQALNKMIEKIESGSVSEATELQALKKQLLREIYPAIPVRGALVQVMDKGKRDALVTILTARGLPFEKMDAESGLPDPIVKSAGDAFTEEDCAKNGFKSGVRRKVTLYGHAGTRGRDYKPTRDKDGNLISGLNLFMVDVNHESLDETEFNQATRRNKRAISDGARSIFWSRGTEASIDAHLRDILDESEGLDLRTEVIEKLEKAVEGLRAKRDEDLSRTQRLLVQAVDLLKTPAGRETLRQSVISEDGGTLNENALIMKVLLFQRYRMIKRISDVARHISQDVLRTRVVIEPIKRLLRNIRTGRELTPQQKKILRDEATKKKVIAALERAMKTALDRDAEDANLDIPQMEREKSEQFIQNAAFSAFKEAETIFQTLLNAGDEIAEITDAKGVLFHIDASKKAIVRGDWSKDKPLEVGSYVEAWHKAGNDYGKLVRFTFQVSQKLVETNSISALGRSSAPVSDIHHSDMTAGHPVRVGVGKDQVEAKANVKVNSRGATIEIIKPGMLNFKDKADLNAHLPVGNTGIAYIDQNGVLWVQVYKNDERTEYSMTSFDAPELVEPLMRLNRGSDGRPIGVFRIQIALGNEGANRNPGGITLHLTDVMMAVDDRLSIDQVAAKLELDKADIWFGLMRAIPGIRGAQPIPAAHPGMSLTQIAEAAGVSISDVRDVLASIIRAQVARQVTSKGHSKGLASAKEDPAQALTEEANKDADWKAGVERFRSAEALLHASERTDKNTALDVLYRYQGELTENDVKDEASLAAWIQPRLALMRQERQQEFANVKALPGQRLRAALQVIRLMDAGMSSKEKADILAPIVAWLQAMQDQSQLGLDDQLLELAQSVQKALDGPDAAPVAASVPSDPASAADAANLQQLRVRVNQVEDTLHKRQKAAKALPAAKLERDLKRLMRRVRSCADDSANAGCTEYFNRPETQALLDRLQDIGEAARTGRLSSSPDAWIEKGGAPIASLLLEAGRVLTARYGANKDGKALEELARRLTGPRSWEQEAMGEMDSILKGLSPSALSPDAKRLAAQRATEIFFGKLLPLWNDRQREGRNNAADDERIQRAAAMLDAVRAEAGIGQGSSLTVARAWDDYRFAMRRGTLKDMKDAAEKAADAMKNLVNQTNPTPDADAAKRTDLKAPGRYLDVRAGFDRTDGSAYFQLLSYVHEPDAKNSDGTVKDDGTIRELGHEDTPDTVLGTRDSRDEHRVDFAFRDRHPNVSENSGSIISHDRARIFDWVSNEVEGAFQKVNLLRLVLEDLKILAAAAAIKDPEERAQAQKKTLWITLGAKGEAVWKDPGKVRKQFRHALGILRDIRARAQVERYSPDNPEKHAELLDSLNRETEKKLEEALLSAEVYRQDAKVTEEEAAGDLKLIRGKIREYARRWIHALEEHEREHAANQKTGFQRLFQAQSQGDSNEYQARNEVLTHIRSMGWSDVPRGVILQIVTNISRGNSGVGYLKASVTNLVLIYEALPAATRAKLKLVYPGRKGMEDGAKAIRFARALAQLDDTTLKNAAQKAYKTHYRQVEADLKKANLETLPIEETLDRLTVTEKDDETGATRSDSDIQAQVAKKVAALAGGDEPAPLTDEQKTAINRTADALFEDMKKEVESPRHTAHGHAVDFIKGSDPKKEYERLRRKARAAAYKMVLQGASREVVMAQLHGEIETLNDMIRLSRKYHGAKGMLSLPEAASLLPADFATYLSWINEHHRKLREAAKAQGLGRLLAHEDDADILYPELTEENLYFVAPDVMKDAEFFVDGERKKKNDKEVTAAYSFDSFGLLVLPTADPSAGHVDQDMTHTFKLLLHEGQHQNLDVLDEGIREGLVEWNTLLLGRAILLGGSPPPGEGERIWKRLVQDFYNNMGPEYLGFMQQIAEMSKNGEWTAADMLLAQATGQLGLLGLVTYDQLPGPVSELGRISVEEKASEFRVEWKYPNTDPDPNAKKYVHQPEDVKTQESMLEKLSLYPGAHRGSFFQIVPSSDKGPHVIREVILGSAEPWSPANRDHNLFGRKLEFDPAEDVSWTGRISAGQLRLHPISSRLRQQIDDNTLILGDRPGPWYAIVDPAQGDEVIGFLSMGSDPSLRGAAVTAILDDRRGEWTRERVAQALRGPSEGPSAGTDLSAPEAAVPTDRPSAQLRERFDALNARVHREMAAEIDKRIEASPASQATAQEISIWYMRRVRELAASMGIDPASITFPLLNADLEEKGHNAFPGVITNWNGRTLEGGSDGRVMRPGRIYSLRFDFALQTGDGQKMSFELKTNHLAGEKRLEAAASGERAQLGSPTDGATARAAKAAEGLTQEQMEKQKEERKKTYQDLLRSQRRRMALAQKASSVYEAALVRTGDPQTADRAVQEFYRSHQITGFSPRAPKDQKLIVPADGGAFSSDGYFAENLGSNTGGLTTTVIFYRLDAAPSSPPAPGAAPDERWIDGYRGLTSEEMQEPLQALRAAYDSSKDPEVQKKAVLDVKKDLAAKGIYFKLHSAFAGRGVRIVHRERPNYARRTADGPAARTTVERLEFVRMDQAVQGLGAVSLGQAFKDISIEPVSAPKLPPATSAARLAQTPDWASRPEAQRVQLLDLALRLLSGRSDLGREEALKVLQGLMRPLKAYEPDEDLTSSAEQQTLLGEWTRILQSVESGNASSAAAEAPSQAASAGFGAELPEWLARMGSEAEWKAVQESRQAESVQAAGMILKAFGGPAAEGLAVLPGANLVRPDGSIDPANKVFLSALQLKADRFGIMAEDDAAAEKIRTALGQAGGLDRWVQRVRVMPEKTEDLRTAFGLDSAARVGVVAEPRQLAGGDVSDVNLIPVLIPGAESPFAPQVGFREAAAAAVSALARASETNAVYQVGPGELYTSPAYQILITEARRFNRPVRVMNFPLLLKQILQAIFGSRMAASTAA
jgi:hypothetical protein